MTTIGYGDMVPVTIMGSKFIAAVLALAGVAMFALPSGIIAAGFARKADVKHRQFSPTCPHCGKDPFLPPKDKLLNHLDPKEDASMQPPDLFSQIIGSNGESKQTDPQAE